MSLSGKQKHYLRGLGQTMRPLFRVGKREITPTLIAQIDQALARRELLKVSLLPAVDDSLTAVVAQLTAALPDVTVAQTIGKTVLLYRPAKEAKHRKISVAVAAIAQGQANA